MKLTVKQYRELEGILAETVHTAFRKGASGDEAHAVWQAMHNLPSEQWESAIDWMLWAIVYPNKQPKKLKESK